MCTIKQSENTKVSLQSVHFYLVFFLCFHLLSQILVLLVVIFLFRDLLKITDSVYAVVYHILCITKTYRGEKY